MTKLTKDFSLEEFSCKDGSVTPPPEAVENLTVLAQNLQVLRDHLGKPIHVTSGYRSPAYNKKVGGKPLSQHPKGKAGDIQVEGMTPKQVAAEIEKLIAAGKMRQGGIGIYPTFTHYDIRGTRARW